MNYYKEVIHKTLKLLWAWCFSRIEDRSWKEFKRIYDHGVICQKPGCDRVGQYAVGDAQQHWACREHANELVDMMLGVASDAFNECWEREKRGEFLPQGQIIHGGGMHPRARRKLR